MGITNFPNGISTFGHTLYNAGDPDVSGNVFYVDANVSTTGRSGKTWDDAFATIAEGLAAAHTDIGKNRAWAKRNTVYYVGDSISEALVLAAEKTDLIGVGSDVGSTPKLSGSFTIGTARQSFRIINMGFIPTSTAPVVTFPAGMHGWEMHHVTLWKSESYASSAGLLSTDSRDWVMKDCRIVPDAGGAKHTIGVNLAGTSSGQGRCLMENCLIVGVEGINVVDTSQAFEGGWIKNNTIIATNLCVDDNSSGLLFTNNNLITAAAGGSTDGSGVVDWNTEMICNNRVHASDADAEIPALDALT